MASLLKTGEVNNGTNIRKLRELTKELLGKLDSRYASTDHVKVMLKKLNFGVLDMRLKKTWQTAYLWAVVRVTERYIKESPVEIAVILDKFGNPVLEKVGSVDSVKFTDEEMVTINKKGFILLHNHPGYGYTLSEQDMDMGYFSNLQYVRAVTPEGIWYQFEYHGETKNHPGGLESILKVKQLHRNHYQTNLTRPQHDIGADAVSFLYMHREWIDALQGNPHVTYSVGRW